MDTIDIDQNFKKKMEELYTFIKQSDQYQKLKKQHMVHLFLSIGYSTNRATVITANHKSFQGAWKNLYSYGLEAINNSSETFSSLKIDWVISAEKVSIYQFIKNMTKTKKNYFRKGISFDKNFKYAFLEQEVNGNAMIQIDKKTHRGYLHEPNIQQYIKKHRPGIKKINFNNVSFVITFTTKSFFLENGQCYFLKSDELNNGRRDVNLNKNELQKIILNGQNYLSSLNKPSGQFTYGYFSCFDKEINFYNMLRHASTLYAMIETYELFGGEDENIVIKRGLDYLMSEGVVIDNNNELAYIIDNTGTNQLEIKLGANAAAILAFTKYTEVFKDDQYLVLAQKLAKGILSLQQDDGSFDHVLHYPSLALKESFRIVYYDGEAAFALMRLYRLDGNEHWINSVEQSFKYFIEKEYWRNHDHWLSYCTNELTKYRPYRKYFQFGLQNVHDKLHFIYQRQTTFPTFLELTIAAYRMVQRIKDTDHENLLLEFDEKKLKETIHVRAEYQRNGYFHPELAMYFKNPNRILGSFFIRHHSFRARIDDVEHYLSGYCQYYKLFIDKE